MTLKDAMEYFLIEQEIKGNTKKTIEGYRCFLTSFINYLQTESNISDVNDLTIMHINKYQLYISRKKTERNKNKELSRRSVQTYIRHLKVFMGFLEAQEIIQTDIQRKIQLPKAEKPVIEILTDDEIMALLSCFGKSELSRRNVAMICLMLDCGLRLEEVTHIKASDVNMDKGYICIMGKGRKGRIVPIGAKVRRAMMNYVYKRRMADNPDDNEYYFLTKERKPITCDTIRNLMHRLKKKTSITRLHAHLLRHTFATNYLIHGLGDVYELSMLLGHADIKITERYLHIASYYTIIQKQRKKTYLDTVRDKNFNS